MEFLAGAWHTEYAQVMISTVSLNCLIFQPDLKENDLMDSDIWPLSQPSSVSYSTHLELLA